MNFWNTESHAFLLGTIFWVGLICFALFLSFYGWKKWKRQSATRYLGLSVFFLGCILAGIWAIAVEPYRIVVRDFELRDTGLPPMRIVVVADFHLRAGKSEKFVNRVVEKINQQAPDVILIPGDFLTSSAKTYVPKLAGLAHIKAPAYYVMGNHDYKINGKTSSKRVETLRKSLQAAELIELRNDSFFLAHKNISIAGVEDNYLRFDDLESALQKIKDEPFILLAHSPDVVDEFFPLINNVSKQITAPFFKGRTEEGFILKKNPSPTLPLEKEGGIKPNLIISGHTHCGQVRVPFIGALPGVIPTENGKKYDRHWYADPHLFVTCGVGESGPAVRFMNPPEVVVLEILD